MVASVKYAADRWSKRRAAVRILEFYYWLIMLQKTTPPRDCIVKESLS
jgi:hypothetical protein